MVSDIGVQTGIPSTAPRIERGFIPEESAIATGPGFGPVIIHYQAFWRPVIGGTFFALSVFVLSWYLMLGCHVGIDSNGFIALGAGSAVWIWLTSCVAFYFGGMIASSISTPHGPGWLKGAVIWGLSIPLALGSYAIVSQNGVMLATLSLPHFGLIENMSATAPVVNYGFFWAAFLTLASALFFSMVGSMTGCACNKDKAATTTSPKTSRDIS